MVVLKEFQNFMDILYKLSLSKFRSSFKLKQKDIDYINDKGFETIERHARDFISKRIAPAFIDNDGKQTPTKGHPVFIAQHATATCCRKCINKWHKFSIGKQLTLEEQNYLVDLIIKWLKRQFEIRN